MAFRRKDAPGSLCYSQAPGLRSEATYARENVDIGDKRAINGKQLAVGLKIELAAPEFRIAAISDREIAGTGVIS